MSKIVYLEYLEEKEILPIIKKPIIFLSLVKNAKNNLV
jgi:hypothetical protein